MPRLFHRPPKYCHHKGTQQATVSFRGQRVYLGPYGSAKSHAAYQEILQNWYKGRDTDTDQKPTVESASRVTSITTATLREKRRAGSPLTINELVLVYRRHAHQYYQKNGAVTREATIIEDVLRFLRKHHATLFLEDFGPVILDDLRNGMISELDWSRKHINKQVSRLTRMFTWAAEKELVNPSMPLALKSLAGLKKGRCKARETAGISCVDDSIVDKTLPQLPDVVADMVRLQRLTGARPGDL